MTVPMPYPQRRVTDKALWRRPLFWFAIVLVVLLVAVLISVIVSAIADGAASQAAKSAKATAASVVAEQNAREAELRSIICGVYVPIGSAHLNGANSALGKTIVSATRKAALELHCPGIH